jgi:putative spermidine/putrescine transport system permease protein
MRTALLAGGILAFALSFDEIVVTTFTAGSGFQTLPQWIYANISRPNNVPIVTVMATFVMALSIPLAWLAQRLSDS